MCSQGVEMAVRADRAEQSRAAFAPMANMDTPIIQNANTRNKHRREGGRLCEEGIEGRGTKK